MRNRTREERIDLLVSRLGWSAILVGFAALLTFFSYELGRSTDSIVAYALYLGIGGLVVLCAREIFHD